MGNNSIQKQRAIVIVVVSAILIFLVQSAMGGLPSFGFDSNSFGKGDDQQAQLSDADSAVNSGSNSNSSNNDSSSSGGNSSSSSSGNGSSSSGNGSSSSDNSNSSSSDNSNSSSSGNGSSSSDNYNSSDGNASSSSSNNSSSSSSNNAAPAPKDDRQAKADAFPRDWRGSFNGVRAEGDTIPRDIYFTFDSVSSGGYLSGVCTIADSSIDPDEYGGSYYIKGTIDWSTGEIYLYGDGWCNRGGLNMMRTFEGYVSNNSTIEGFCYVGDRGSMADWYMSAW